jgi:dienelactone hydrolase
MLLRRPASCYVGLGDAVTAAHSPLAGMGFRLGFRRIFLALAAIGYCVAAQAAPEPVEIPADGFTLHATLFRPDGDGPFPAIVALHDCGGLSDHPATESQLYTEWANILVAKGFVVLFPDSFSSRGLGPQCRQSERKVHARRERVADANAARRWLQTQGFVKGDRISLLGWSNGGSAALWTVRPTTKPKDVASDFRSAVALYPSCRLLRETAWSARVPTLILIGSADDLTPTSVCQQMVAGARGRTARAEIIVYPGALHEFDRANTPARPRGSAGAAHGTNSSARNDALKRVPEWLAR